MSSQDSEGESYVADYIADPKVYGDVENYGWTTEEEEDYDLNGTKETSSDEDEDPLLNLGTCMWSSRSRVSLIKQRNLPSSLSLFIFCRKTSRHYVKRYLSLSRRSRA
jgi:hypothetical protein